MAKKKADEPEKSPEEKALEQKVDAMMDARSDVSKVAATVNDSLAEKLGVKKDDVKTPKASHEIQTAPELPGQDDDEDNKVKVSVKPKSADPKPVEPTEPEETESKPDDEVEENKLEDVETDKAVDDIVAKEGDTVLAVDDARKAHQQKAIQPSSGWKDKLRSFFKSKWTWLCVVLILLVVFAVPATRYKVLGLVVKKSVTITVLDNKTATPVSSAQVELAGDSVKTDANGKAHLKAALGKHSLIVSKRYYRDLSTSYFVGFKTAPSSEVKLVATGRLVPVTVLNKITGQPVSGAAIQVLGTTSRTNAKGLATIALPTTASSQTAKLVLSGYNSSNVTVQVTDKTVKANSFELTPAGHIYFLSNRSGNLDVVKANLDGSDRKIVLAGTGKEDPRTTSLLASRDWRYLVLKARRDGNQASLYLIDTSNDKVTQFDNGDADFNLVGWYDHNFVYVVARNSLQYWQTGRQGIKSYDADHQQINQLDQTQAEGTSSNYAYQYFSNFYVVDGVVVYNTIWYGSNSDGTAYNLTGKNATIRGVQSGGQNKKDYQSFDSATIGGSEARVYEPKSVYFAIYDKNTKTNYYEYEDQTVKNASIDQTAFDKTYPTFLLSPSSKQTLWSDLVDGKNSLFTGDANASNKKQIANLSDYTPYGWFSDSYILVSKNSSELYIMSTSGSKNLKVTDYYKPAQTYAGYGYGYGGL